MATTPVIVSIDCVLFGLKEGRLCIAAYQRGREPFAGCQSLPGGPLLKDETLVAACARKLASDLCLQGPEGALALSHLEQLYTFDDPRRDPRKRALSVTYFALVSADRLPVLSGRDAVNARWLSVDEALSPASVWAFDHRRIVEAALARLRGKLSYSSVGFNLLPAEFSLAELQKLHEAILGTRLDKRNFRAQFKDSPRLVPTRKSVQSRRGPAAQLYKFVPTTGS